METGGAIKSRRRSVWRHVWSWHLWLGLVIVVPSLFWMGTALVFVIWPIQTVRGAASSTGRATQLQNLSGWMLPPPEKVEGARSVTIRQIEGRPLAAMDRGESTEVWDLGAQQSLGPVLPLPWAREIAKRDFSGIYEEESVYLLPRSGPGLRQAGKGPDLLHPPTEYSGPRPAYVFHLRSNGTHVYVDALSGELRARRTGIWRIYDLAFRLHSFEFTGDGTKRGVIWTVVGLWMVVSISGLFMAFRRQVKPRLKR